MSDKLVRDNIVQFQQGDFVINIPLDGSSMPVDANAEDLYSISECAAMGVHPATPAGEAYKTRIGFEEEFEEYLTQKNINV